MANETLLKRVETFDDFVTEKSDILKNSLFGDYDDAGNYIVPNKIKEELLGMQKYKKHGYGNSIFCFANKPGLGEVAFEIVYNNKTEDNYAFSNIYVLENVSKINGYLQNTIKTHIAEFKDSIRNYLEKSYDFFNVLVYADDSVKTEKLIDDKFLDSYIMAKKHFSSCVNATVTDELNNAYDSYLKQKFDLLKNNPNAYTKAVLKTYDSEQKKISKHFLAENNSPIAHSELLDKAFEEINENSDFLYFENELNKLIQPKKEAFVKSANALLKDAKNKAFNELSKKERNKIKELNIQIKDQSEKLKLDKESQEVEVTVTVAHDAKEQNETVQTELVVDSAFQSSERPKKDISGLVR